jgi:hypothetical protein
MKMRPIIIKNRAGEGEFENTFKKASLGPDLGPISTKTMRYA